MMPKNVLGTNKLSVQFSLPFSRQYDLAIYGQTKARRSEYVIETLQGNFQQRLVISVLGKSLEVFAPTGAFHAMDLDAIQFIRLFRHLIADLRQEIARPLLILVEVSEIPRSILGAIIGQLHADKIFDMVDFVYTQADYFIQNGPAADRYNDDVFLQAVLENASNFVPVPFAGGQYSSAHRMDMFVSCGLDARLLVPRLRSLEPYRMILTLPEALKTSNLLQKIGLNFPPEKLDSNVHLSFVRSLSLFPYIELLRTWHNGLKDQSESVKTKGLLFSLGWKTHHVLACLWSAAEGRVPVFTTEYDFVADVEIKPTRSVVCISVKNIAVGS
jgi:hypothetical protein